jgi:hypothetical protein
VRTWCHGIESAASNDPRIAEASTATVVRASWWCRSVDFNPCARGILRESAMRLVASKRYSMTRAEGGGLLIEPASVRFGKSR